MPEGDPRHENILTATAARTMTEPSWIGSGGVKVEKSPINELAAALAKAQAEFTHAAQNSFNPFFKAKYADLASCVDACRAALTKNGLSFIQHAESLGKNVKVMTVLMHSSGQSLESPWLCMEAKSSGAQDIGSAITYCRRFSLCAFVGVVPAGDDDDGAAATPYSEAKKKGKAAPEQEAPAEPEEALQETVALILKVTKAPNGTGILVHPDRWLEVKDAKHIAIAKEAAEKKTRCIVEYRGNLLVSIQKEG